MELGSNPTYCLEPLPFSMLQLGLAEQLFHAALLRLDSPIQLASLNDFRIYSPQDISTQPPVPALNFFIHTPQLDILLLPRPTFILDLITINPSTIRCLCLGAVDASMFSRLHQF
jgi:hypothetical protein